MPKVKRSLQTLQSLLKDMGGQYTVAGVLEQISTGRMQSFTVGETWVITEVQVFPNKRTLNVVAIIGDLSDLSEVSRRLVNFAKEENCDNILTDTNGRAGWDKVLCDGWSKTRVTYEKDLKNG